MTPYLLVIFCVIALAFGQIMFKLVSGRIDGLHSLLTDAGSLAILGAAVLAYGASTAAWVVALQKLPLSHAYLFVSLGFLIVPVAAFFIFSEPLSLRFVIGALVVVTGLIIAVA